MEIFVLINVFILIGNLLFFVYCIQKKEKNDSDYNTRIIKMKTSMNDEVFAYRRRKKELQEKVLEEKKLFLEKIINFLKSSSLEQIEKEFEYLKKTSGN